MNLERSRDEGKSSQKPETACPETGLLENMYSAGLTGGGPGQGPSLVRYISHWFSTVAAHCHHFGILMSESHTQRFKFNWSGVAWSLYSTVDGSDVQSGLITTGIS